MARSRPWQLFFTVAAFLSAITCAAAAEDPFRNLIAKRQYAKAAALVEKSARKGNPLSQYRFAVMLRSGLGVKRDEAKARNWLKKSAAAGNEDASRLLKRLSTVVISDSISATPVAPARTAATAGLSALGPLPSDRPSWTMLAAARTRMELDPAAPTPQLNEPDAVGMTPLMAAVRSGNRAVVKRLLAQAAAINVGDKRGLTALHWAVTAGNPELAGLLLSAGADTTKRMTKSGASPALLAAGSCDPFLLQQIRSQFRANHVTRDGQNLLHVLAANCADPAPFMDVLTADMLQESDSKGRTPLWLASERGSEAWVNALLAGGADARIAGSDGLTPLHAAAANGNPGVVEALLQSGADPQALDASGNTPLMLAAARGHGPAVSLLLPFVADLNLKNLDGETALLLAVKSGKPGVIRTLVENGASVTSRSIARDTPEKMAERLQDPAISAALE